MERLANMAQTTLAAAIDADDTTLTVAASAAFPGAGNFRLRIDSEILLVTGVAGDVFTVTRGAEGTTAVNHSSGSTVEHVLTAASLLQFIVENAAALGLTASRALATNGSGTIVVSATTAAELAFLSGVTSGVQSQLNARLVAASNLGDLGSAATARGNLGLGTLATQNGTIADYAPLDSPALVGVPTGPTAAAGSNTVQLATCEYVRAEVAALVDSAPGTLDTLQELASALGEDPNFAATTAAALGAKQPLDATLTALAGLTIAANSTIVGTGADAFSVVSVGANQFLARSSAGALGVKTLTDFGLSLLDDSDAATARATLGLTNALLSSLFTADGDILVRIGGTVQALAKGTEGQVLKIVSGSPAWADSGGAGGGPFTYNDWVNGSPGVSSHVWTLRVPKDYDGTTADLSLDTNAPSTVTANDISCDVDSAGLQAALSGWPLDGGVPPAVTDGGTYWEWVITIDSSQVDVDANRSASEFT